MRKKFLSNIFKIKSLLTILLYLGLNGCSSEKKNEKECSYELPRGCEDFIGLEIHNRGSRLPGDGIVLLEDWTFFLTYFDNNINDITEKYIKVDCNCEVLYFGDNNPNNENDLN